MFSRKAKMTTISFVLLLALSGASYGFLLGRSHQLKAEAEQATEQIQSIGHKVQNSGALVSRGLNAVQRMLIK